MPRSFSFSDPALRRKILVAGFIAGTLDILAAFATTYYVNPDKSPLLVLKYIAGKLLGKTTAYAGGAEMLALGLLMHYLIAYTFTIFFFWVYPRISFLSRNVVLTTIVFGLFTWIIMNLVALPLLVATPVVFKWVSTTRSVLTLVFMIGLPVALFARKFYGMKQAPDTV